MQKRYFACPFVSYGSFMICDNIPHNSGRIRLKWKDEASCFSQKKKKEKKKKLREISTWMLILDD